MFTDDIRCAIDGAPKRSLPQIAQALAKAFTGGQVEEADFEELQALIDAKNARACAQTTSHRRVGSRPRSPASMERRRRWAASGALPPGLAAHFTIAEQAALAVITAEVRQNGDCRLTVGHIAALAGISETSTRNALREARRLRLLHVQERRLTASRNLPNVIRVVSAAWLGWLRLRGKSAFKTVQPTPTYKKDIIEKPLRKTDGFMRSRPGLSTRRKKGTSSTVGSEHVAVCELLTRR